MQRRNFLKGAAVLSAASVLSPVVATATTSALNIVDGRRRFVFTHTYDVQAPKGASGETKLWVPVPEDAHFQQLRKLSFNGNYAEAYVTADNAYGAKTLFARWPNSKGKMTLTVEMVIDTLNWEPALNGELKNYKAPKTVSYPAEVKRFLEPTAHIPTDGVVKKTADKIVGKEKDPLKKARMIYEWTTANMFRDNAVIGCGVGDAGKTLESGHLGGKCTDISSVFVALMRAAGIPAREMFGIRLGSAPKMGQYSAKAFGGSDEKGFATITGGQHCRAQFYLAGHGWVPCDPADVTKGRLYENLKHDHPSVQAVNEYFFGNWEMNWVGFNYGRDFHLSPEAEQTPINNFGYPYAEVDGEPLNYYDAKTFAYVYTAQEVK